MSLEIFLLSLQAAGAISDVIGTQQQVNTVRRGAQVEKELIETRIAEEQLGASLAAVDSMKALRQTLASQRAMFAANGTNPGAGSAFIAQATSINEAGSDERIRRINLLSKEATLRAGGALTAMHAIAGETQLGQQLSKRLFEQIPFSELHKKLETKKPAASIGNVNKGS